MVNRNNLYLKMDNEPDTSLSDNLSDKVRHVTPHRSDT